MDSRKTQRNKTKLSQNKKIPRCPRENRLKRKFNQWFWRKTGNQPRKSKWDKKQPKMFKEKAVEIEHSQRRNDFSISGIPKEEKQYNWTELINAITVRQCYTDNCYRKKSLTNANTGGAKSNEKQEI